MRSDLVDLTMKIHHTTDRAILVSDDGDRDNAVWLPLSLVEVERNRDGTAIITMPENIAHERGLI